MIEAPKDQPSQAQIDQLKIKALEEQAKEFKKQQLIKNAEAAINGLKDLQKAEKNTEATPVKHSEHIVNTP